ncbi:MAG: hypothetical protein JWM98_719 [Thermoleophilia bacterium]|nr:hypothetical protein [Thermoleophilia bacterium]
MPSELGVRQRAVICQDCWFFQELSCALANPENGVCANRRPVNGRIATARATSPVQATLVPVAPGHAMAPAAVAPFAADAPESTFSLAQVAEAAPRSTLAAAATAFDGRIAQPAAARTAPPSFREIRSGRAAAAARVPVAQVTIPLAEVEGDLAPLQASLPGMDQLVERVRQRTAARLSRAGAPRMA